MEIGIKLDLFMDLLDSFINYIEYLVSDFDTIVILLNRSREL